MAKTCLERVKAYQERQRTTNKTSPKKKTSVEITLLQRRRKRRTRIAEAVAILQQMPCEYLLNRVQ